MIECVGSSRGMLIAWVGVGDCTFIDLGSLKLKCMRFTSQHMQIHLFALLVQLSISLRILQIQTINKSRKVMYACST
jgi:hypothetical protein